MANDVGEEQEKANLDAATVAYPPPKVDDNGVTTFEQDFKQAGHYVGIVMPAFFGICAASARESPRPRRGRFIPLSWKRSKKSKPPAVGADRSSGAELSA